LENMPRHQAQAMKRKPSMTILTQLDSIPDRKWWVRLGFFAAVAGIVAVLVVQAVSLAIWPDLVRFGPLDSYVRSAIFTAIPAVGATALLAWLAARSPQPIPTFLRISVIVLLFSIVPDYLLPIPEKTLLASTVAALLHVIAAATIVGTLVLGYQNWSVSHGKMG
jgi:hypothetical protein